MKNIKLEAIASALGLECDSDITISSVSTDTRKITDGSLFIAIAGEKFDGHDFCKKAQESGAAALICSRKVEADIPVLYVEDTRKAYLDIAAYYRSTFDIPVIGLTGSVGKTTTKEMIALVVASRYKTVKTQGNLNNEIGMPATLLGMDEDTEAAVIEMGMNHAGEISRLTKTSKPSISVITNIGVCHIENLGSRENILKAKLEILEGMKQGAPLILNGDNDMLSGVRTSRNPVVFFGIDSPICKVRATDIREENGCTVFTAEVFGEKAVCTLPVIGLHNVYDALAAFAVGHELGIPAEQCAAALGEYAPSGMRQRMVKANGITFIEDCYNASPDSVKASLNTLASVDCKRRIAVLGDMLELGSYSEKAHAECGRYCGEKGIDVLFTLGEASKTTAESALQSGVGLVQSFMTREELAEAVAAELKDGDAVEFKASHSMKLEDVISAVYAKLGIVR